MAIHISFFSQRYLKTDIILFMLVFSNGFSYLLSQEMNIKSINDQFIEYFENKSYEQALALCDDLYDNRANDLDIMYITGKYYAILNIHQNRAIELLRSAAARGMEGEVHYYLGLAYQQNYQFNEAIQSYHSFMNTEKKSDFDDNNILYRIESCRNGAEMIRAGLVPLVIDQKLINREDFYVFYNQQNNHGAVVVKPGELKSNKDIREETMTWMYLPNEVKGSNYLFFTSLVKGKPDHFDIFRVHIKDDGTYDEPENLGIPVNSTLDEAYPFFDQQEKILFFASKGHQSIGGYDIFKSKYDGLNDRWSKPENIDFPLNSTADDFFYISLPGDQYLLSTSRNSPFNQVHTYLLKIDKDGFTRTFATHEEVLEAAALNKKVVLYGRNSNTNEELKGSTGMNKSDGHHQQEPEIDNEEYRSLLDEALKYQVKADSVARLIHDKEGRIKSALSKEKKSVYEIEKERLEKKYLVLQEMANMKYQKVRKWEEKYGVDEIKQTRIIKDTDVDGITVYRFVKGGANETVEKQAKPKQVEETNINQPITQSEKEKTPEGNTSKKSFEILNNSPYSDSHPIPVNEKLPFDLVYRIQLGAYSKAVPHDFFGGISPLTAEFIESRGITKYFAGLFRDYEGAKENLQKIKSLGYKDSFIVAYYKNSKINLSKAREIEKTGN